MNQHGIKKKIKLVNRLFANKQISDFEYKKRKRRLQKQLKIERRKTK